MLASMTDLAFPPQMILENYKHIHISSDCHRLITSTLRFSLRVTTTHCAATRCAELSTASTHRLQTLIVTGLSC